MPGPLLRDPGPLRASAFDEPRAPLQAKADQLAIEAHPEHQALLNSTRPVPPRPVPPSTPAFASDEQFAQVQREAAAISGEPLGPTTPYRPGFRAGEVLMEASVARKSVPGLLVSIKGEGRTIRSNRTNSNQSRYREAIASIESHGSGDYSAIGPKHEKLGRALGRYQVMESNVGPWTREAIGRSLTADQFLADPDAQDAVFDHIFGQYVERFGSEEKAAQAWFAGAGGVGTSRRDVLGTSVSEYGEKFTKALR